MKMHTRILLGALTVCLMGGVFSLYLQPHFMVQLANQVWACF